MASCKLCYSPFTTRHPLRIPLKISCEHSFCTECIKKLKDLQGQVISCPLCQVNSVIPEQGVDYLEKNLEILGLSEIASKEYDKCQHCIRKTYPPKAATLHCLDCDSVYCGSCSDQIHLKIDNQDHLIRLSKSRDDLRSGRLTSESSRSCRTTPARDEKRPISARSLSPDAECEEHHLPLKVLCKHDQVQICTLCKTTSHHRFHDCFHVSEAEERERTTIYTMQDEIDVLYQEYLGARGDVQAVIETLKNNTKNTKDSVSRKFRELRMAVDQSEKALISALDDISEERLGKLRKQLSAMIDISSAAKSISRKCEYALSLDYYAMMGQRAKFETDAQRVIELMKDKVPVQSSDLFCQFPQLETLLSGIKTIGYIVRAPPPPENFKCTLTSAGDVHLSWDVSKKMLYTYEVTLFAVYASIGEGNSFVMVDKVKRSPLILPRTRAEFEGKQLVQFQVSCINVVGEGTPCFPLCIRLVKPRSPESDDTDR